MHSKRWGKNKYKEISLTCAALAGLFFVALVLGKLYLSENTGLSEQETKSSEMAEGEENRNAEDAFEREDIAGGIDNNITWRIDADGKLTVEGTGDFSSSSLKPWYDEREKIKSAEVRVTGLKDASYMFFQCNEMICVDMSGFDTHDVTNMQSMFSNCSSLKSLNLSDIDTGNVTNMSCMFINCRSLTSVDLSGFDTHNVTNMSHMFNNCSSLTSLDLSGFDTGSVTDMSWMFELCSNLTNLELSDFDTGNVTKMACMFRHCSSLTSLDLSSFDTGNVTDMRWMFELCSSLTSLDLSGFDTENVTEMLNMFRKCSSLTSLDMSSFDIGGVTDMSSWVFDGCSKLSTICIPYNVPAHPENGAAVLLPTAAETDIWYDAAGTVYTTLPEELDHSIILTKNAITDAL